jgi:hypothetical protein
VRIAVLRHAWRARPISPASLSAATGLTLAEVHAAHINFFCSRDHVVLWQTARPDLQGTVFTLGEAAAFAREHFAAVIRAVRSSEQ